MKRYSALLALIFGLSTVTVVQSIATSTAQASTVVVQTKWDPRLNNVTTGKDGLIVWVDIKKQRLSIFSRSNKKFITSYQILTGKDGYETPTGSFFINGNREYDPNGNTIELTGSYGTAKVQIWNPFVNNEIAFHNAPWRSPSEFGSTSRRPKYGSHGCVNMDGDDALDLYKRTKNGTRVLVTN
jgi:lipoprotein-anchoring transpeptidase ErfK/SrfK